ncbi:MAG: tryptophan--tRNA ligase [Patescibacteria group bacterium]
MQRVFSAAQPTGTPHLGNYLGFLKQAVELQESYDCIYSIVDLHALTVPRDPDVLRNDILGVAALYLACGLDPKKSILFVQSDVKEHAELCWLLNTLTKISELKLMHQFKEKSKEHPESINMGLFDYPVLMAADILLYNTDLVPIGEDQKQHVELTREIARRWNMRFGQTFTLPKAHIAKTGARIMSLLDPAKKMAKSASSAQSYVSLLDDAHTVRQKIKRAVTDSGSEITLSPAKPALSNLLAIYHLLSNKTFVELEARYKGRGYGEFKSDLAEVVVAFLSPIQERYTALLKKPKKLHEMLSDGAARARIIAVSTMKKVRANIGIGI